MSAEPMRRLITRLAIACALVVVSGCASIDYDYPRDESYFDPDTADTRLGQNIAPLVATKPPGQSGFYPMEDGVREDDRRTVLPDQE
jgi:putative cardiolipin synthase